MEQIHGRLSACEVRASGSGVWVSTLMLDWKETNSLQFWELWTNWDWADYWGDSKMNTMQAPRLQSLSVRTHKDSCNWSVLWSEGQNTFRQLPSTAGIETCQMQRLQIAAGACQPHRHPQSTRQICHGQNRGRLPFLGKGHPSLGIYIPADGWAYHTALTMEHMWTWGFPRYMIESKARDKKKILYAIIAILQSFERKQCK